MSVFIYILAGVGLHGGVRLGFATAYRTLDEAKAARKAKDEPSNWTIESVELM